MSGNGELGGGEGLTEREDEGRGEVLLRKLSSLSGRGSPSSTCPNSLVFTNEETEAQRSEMTCPISHCCFVADLQLEPRSGNSGGWRGMCIQGSKEIFFQKRRKETEIPQKELMM